MVSTVEMNADEMIPTARAGGHKRCLYEGLNAEVFRTQRRKHSNKFQLRAAEHQQSAVRSYTQI